MSSEPARKGAPSELAKFLHDPAKVAFAALLLTSVAVLEGYLLWNKLRARATPAPVAQAPVMMPASPEPVPTPAATRPAPAPEKPAAISPPPAPITAPKSPPGSVATKPAPAERKPAEPRKSVAPATDAKRPPRKPEPAPRPAVEAPAAQPATPAAPVISPRTESATPKSGSQTLQPITREPLQFPIAAVRQGVTQGRVKARATIDAAGNVMSVEILNAYPQRLFDRAVMESLSRWKFPPGANQRRYDVDVEFKR
ncbi:MAG: TonB family protein [Betaproteobacteria bacterium]|nr:TonB family protein [Betaproteobacteria bacterium]